MSENLVLDRAACKACSSRWRDGPMHYYVAAFLSPWHPALAGDWTDCRVSYSGNALRLAPVGIHLGRWPPLEIEDRQVDKARWIPGFLGGEVAIRHDGALTIVRCPKSQKLAGELGRAARRSWVRLGPLFDQH
jgi:hypothetical protein